MLSPLRLITVFAPGDPLAPQLAPFSDALIDSAWFREVTADYGIAPPESSAQVTGAPLAAGSVLDESQLLAYVAAVAAGPSLAPDGRTLYLVYLPEAVTVTLSGQGVSCKKFSGFHDWAAAGAGAATYGIAIVPRCSSYLDDLTYPASHEVIEAVTDNGNGTGWYLDPADGSTGGPPEEIGDLCSGTATLEDKWLYTRVYSNLAAANGGDPCVPADAEPFFATSTPQAHYRGRPGETMDIPLIGWSTDSVPDWFVDVKLSPASASQADWHAQIVDAAVAQGAWYQPFYNAGPTLNNGKTATLRVTVPADSAPASFYVESYRGSPPPRGFDWSHLWKLEVQVAP